MNREEIVNKEMTELSDKLLEIYQRLVDGGENGGFITTMRAVSEYLESKDDPKSENYNAIGYAAYVITRSF